MIESNSAEGIGRRGIQSEIKLTKSWSQHKIHSCVCMQYHKLGLEIPQGQQKLVTTTMGYSFHESNPGHYIERSVQHAISFNTELYLLFSALCCSTSHTVALEQEESLNMCCMKKWGYVLDQNVPNNNLQTPWNCVEESTGYDLPWILWWPSVHDPG